VAKYQIKFLMRRTVGVESTNVLNLSVDPVLFHSVIWRALLILKRENKDFHFEVYSEGQKLTNGGEFIRVEGGGPT